MRSKKTLVTGSSGFVGSHLVDLLLNHKYDFVAASRSHYFANDKRSMRSPELGANADWSKNLKGCETVVHCAARAHIFAENSGCNAAEVYSQINEKGTSRLVSQAIDAGVKRFIFISSIGAVAEKSNKPLCPLDQCNPITPYARSKLGAEKAIQELCSGTKMSYTIIRPPLVYGPRSPGNMERLLKVADTGFPLPLFALDSNQRSFVGVSNLIDLILVCLEHPAAANQTFHVSDDDDISTAELLRRMGKALGKPVRNLPIPQNVLKTGLRLIGKGDWVDKLCGELRVDISETKRLLGWKPKVTMEEELERTAVWWRSRQGRGLLV